MYNKNIGRSLCRRRPVSMQASAGLYAGIGRSLCRHRPVSMPTSAGLYAGKKLLDRHLRGKTLFGKSTFFV